MITKQLTKLLLASTLLLGFAAQAAVIKSMRFWQSPESTRVVFDLTSPVEHELSVLKNPDRIVVDIPDSRVTVDLSQLEIKSDLVKRVRQSKPPKEGVLRLVLDLTKSAEPNSFSLKPYQEYSDRLVIDLVDKKRKVIKPPVVDGSSNRDIIVAIDAGHGGEDPGARGPTGQKEKHITLELAKELARQINSVNGLKAVLTRETDFYLSLRKRTAIARQHRADLFVSIHADSFKNSRARGASVWILSTRGARSELARWLRKQETESELLGGVDTNLDLSVYEKPVAQVILDLQMEHSIQASLTLGEKVHNEMARVAPKMHKKHVEEAGFVVLKNPDIPSILVESGFISNPQEERLLKTSDYRRKLASAVKEGVIDYFKSHAPDGTKFANLYRKNVYHVKRGDSLIKVARRFNTSVSKLKQANKLTSNMVRIGQKLVIPSS
ncbi:N-acetylmuramoyl-L-alanine amidase [Kangiella sediminilitoris]|uniref:N-acetylmuramoyl-L-alanine amidase AmiC n=1 Tax=Kangiella sediminilitoris TaxID=1144748 RepID=A0A1B3BCZ7_9GAMM|nr:N-acetylmuramoyl-L-alanine amidase [Kangiella sediminilitoris]AOE50623.1 N-acetylmuramoyl-L-alanine amidase [Kangiella sediminilitoris]